MEEQTCIGNIGNYYGGLEIKSENNKFFWGIENYNGYEWEEIPEYLYQTLIKYKNESRTEIYPIN